MATDNSPVDSGDWQPVGGGTLNSRIRLEILRFMTSHKLSAGDRLPSERELAATLRVSRPSLREAVRSLQAEGRLVVKHGQGVFVAEPSAQRSMRESMARLDHNLAELFAMREVLEVPAAQWAARNKDTAAIAAVQVAFERLDAALAEEPRDYDLLQQLDAEFHIRIVQAAGNRLLEQTQGVLNELLRTGMQTTLAIEGRAERSRQEHQRILEAIFRGDAAAAARAARAHVKSARDAANRRIQAVTAEALAADSSADEREHRLDR
ncbi:FadR/GntR family transcriptional regulator [Nocardioides sp. LHG3406-4]|uniref:FadR/GntR family transcriptional regulator n=1 Tax=Nocardioides sp. LHG3406-4 TaxID=2804575 RepID=UPI003CEFC535